jgi:hypothetical protein
MKAFHCDTAQYFIKAFPAYFSPAKQELSRALHYKKPTAPPAPNESADIHVIG